MGASNSNLVDQRSNDELFRSIRKDKKLIILTDSPGKISRVCQEDFSEIMDLEELTLEGRGIQTLEDDCFSLLTNLKKLFVCFFSWNEY